MLLVLALQASVPRLRIPVDAESTAQLLEANPGKDVSVEDESAVVLLPSDRRVVVPWFEQHHLEEVSVLNDDLTLEYDSRATTLSVRMEDPRQSEWDFQLGNWNEEADGHLLTSGVLVDFGGPTLDLRCASVAWSSRVAPKTLVEFVPDFVGELRHEDESAEDLRKKCEKWVNAGVAAAWFIDPAEQVVEVYRPDKVEVHEKPLALDEPALPGFIMHFLFVWEPLSDTYFRT